METKCMAGDSLSYCAAEREGGVPSNATAVSGTTHTPPPAGAGSLSPGKADAGRREAAGGAGCPPSLPFHAGRPVADEALDYYTNADDCSSSGACSRQSSRSKRYVWFAALRAEHACMVARCSALYLCPRPFPVPYLPRLV